MSDPLFPDPADADSTIMIPRPGGGRLTRRLAADRERLGDGACVPEHDDP